MKMVYKLRQDWGAREPTAPYRRHIPKEIVIHHTANPSASEWRGDKSIQAIQDFHMSRRGFPDIGYHFVIAPDGVVYEGVPLLAVGSHVKNANTGRIGIALVVNSDVEPLSGAAWDALLAVFEWIKGQIRTIESVKAHRDFPTVNTSCPGRFLYARMDEIRALWGLAKSRDK